MRHHPCWNVLPVGMKLPPWWCVTALLLLILLPATPPPPPPVIPSIAIMLTLLFIHEVIIIINIQCKKFLSISNSSVVVVCGAWVGCHNKTMGSSSLSDQQHPSAGVCVKKKKKKHLTWHDKGRVPATARVNNPRHHLLPFYSLYSTLFLPVCVCLGGICRDFFILWEGKIMCQKI